MEISELLGFLKVEDGKIVVDENGYKAKAQSELDKARQQASETASTNAEKKLRDTLEKEIKAKLEEEAKLTAEQKLEADRKAFLEEKKEFDKARIKSMYEDAGMSEVEIEVALGLIGDDSAKNLETAKKFAEARKAANESAKLKFQEELQHNTPNPSGNGNGEGKSVGEMQAERFAKSAKASDYVDLSGRGEE